MSRPNFCTKASYFRVGDDGKPRWVKKDSCPITPAAGDYMCGNCRAIEKEQLDKAAEWRKNKYGDEAPTQPSRAFRKSRGDRLGSEGGPRKWQP